MSEDDGFVPRESEKPLREVALSLRIERDRLRVLPRVDPLYGLPPRRRRPPAVHLLPGQWLSSAAEPGSAAPPGYGTGRTGCTFNIAHGPVAPDVFLSEPTFLVDERGPVR
ncbi:hypothetical protein SCALM49S_06453 [Streptomyces californicus]